MSQALPPRPVIFDTDPGIDDAMALWMLARHPGLDLRAITTVHGNAPVGTTTRNALALVDFFGLDVPVAAGADDALLPRTERFFPPRSTMRTAWAAERLCCRPPGGRRTRVPPGS